MPETLSRKISPNSFFQNNSEENVQSMQQSSDALNTAETALVKVNSNDKYLQSLIQSITTQNTETSQQNGEFSKSISFLNSSYSSLSSGLQSLRMDVESISKYLFDEQKQREKSLEQRETIIAATKDKQEKQGIIQSIRKSVVGGVQGAFQSGGAGGDKSGEGSFFKDLIKGAVGAAGIGLGTGIDNALNPPPDGGGGGGGGKWKPLLDLISSVESSTDKKNNGYDAQNGAPGGVRPGLSQMTIGEIAKNAPGASGRYQQMPQFLLGRAKSAGYTEKTIFSPAVQDTLAIKLIEGRGGNSWLSGKMKTEDFMQGLADEWAALPNAYGKFSYPRQSSSLKPEKVKSVLAQVKQQSTAKPQSTSTATGQQGTSQALDVKPDQITMKAPSGDVSAPFTGVAGKNLSSQVKPNVPQKIATEITPPPATSTVVTLPAIKQDSKGVNSVVNSTPDAPPVFETNNPLTRLWTIASINHLNLNAAIPHIYG